MSADWLAFIGNFGIAGILAWYLYYTTSVLGPRAHDAHQATIRDLIADFRSDLKEERRLRLTMHNDLMMVHRDFALLVNQMKERPCLFLSACGHAQAENAELEEP